MYVAVTYDISDDRRRTKLHKRLKDFGVPVQYSVFECDLEPSDVRALKATVAKVIKPQEDHVRYYHLCAECAGKIEATMGGTARFGEAIVVGEMEEDYEAEPSKFVSVGEYSQMAEACAADNLRLAFKHVDSKRGCAGVDTVTLSKFAKNLRENLFKLQAALLDGTYKPLPVRRVFIPKKDGGRRPLGIPTVRDRVAQQAVYQVIGPIWDPEMEEVSFAYRPGRSVGKAVKAITKLRDRGYEWVVDADINDYFENIDHKMLMDMVATKISDKHILRLVDMWLKAQVLDGKRLTEHLKGTPQGGVISPLLANIYLDYMDKKLLADGYKLVRYADDFVVLCSNKASASRAVKRVEEVLSDLKLELKAEKTRITSFGDGFEFLGNVFAGKLVLPAKKLARSRFGRWTWKGKR